MTVQTTEEKQHYSDEDYRSLHALYVKQHAEIERLKAELARERSYNPAHSIRAALDAFDAAKGK